MRPKPENRLNGVRLAPLGTVLGGGRDNHAHVQIARFGRVGVVESLNMLRLEALQHG